VRPLLSLLQRGGLLLMTLKLPGTGRDRGELVERVAALLVRCWVGCGLACAVRTECCLDGLDGLEGWGW